MIQKLLRKTSGLLLLSFALSLLAPIASYAADLTFFWYRPASDSWSPGLSGYVYTKDPDSVSVRAIKDGTVTEVTYKTVTNNFLYDDNNTPYSNVELSHSTLAIAPSSLSLDLEGQTYVLTGVADPAPYQNYYRFKSSLSANLGSLRMPGQFRASTVTAATYLPAGSDMVSFSPSVGNIAGENGIVINLPYNDSANTTFNSETITLSDFEVIDRTSSVTSSVYLSGGFWDSSIGKLSFNLGEPLVQGHQYLVKLSPTSSGNEIMLPTAGTYTSSMKIGFWIHDTSSDGRPISFLVDKNSVYFRNLTLGSSPYIPPYVPGPVNPPGQDQVVVNKESLKNGSKDKVAVDIAGGKKQVLLPANAADLVGDRKLELKSERLTVEIPPEVLKKLQSLVPSDQLDGAQISFSMDAVGESATTELLNTAGNKANANLKAAGEVYEFKLSVITADGKATSLSEFQQPITLRLKVRDNANQALLGLYFIGDDGSLEYAGGKLIDGEMVANVSHFSKYAVLEFDKTFDDVPAQFWASGVIKELTAKHIISGQDDRTFAPQQQMTRAQFAALIARTLGLKAANAPIFTDVDSGNSYADAIAAVNEAGIIHGRSTEKFTPDDRITREEMVTMIIKAYEYKSGKKVNSAAATAYPDRMLAAGWALPYIDAATSIGLVQGRSNGTFAPKQFMTRAEGAQMIYQLFKSN